MNPSTSTAQDDFNQTVVEIINGHKTLAKAQADINQAHQSFVALMVDGVLPSERRLDAALLLDAMASASLRQSGVLERMAFLLRRPE